MTAAPESAAAAEGRSSRYILSGYSASFSGPRVTARDGTTVEMACL